MGINDGNIIATIMTPHIVRNSSADSALCMGILLGAGDINGPQDLATLSRMDLQK
jgi:hypothetical protein